MMIHDSAEDPSACDDQHQPQPCLYDLGAVAGAVTVLFGSAFTRGIYTNISAVGAMIDGNASPATAAAAAADATATDVVCLPLCFSCMKRHPT